MKKILIILFVIFFSCSSTKDLNGKKYTYKSKNRELSLTFENDSMCVIKNIFFCENIDSEFKEIRINATYKREKDIIILKNTNCTDTNCIYPQSIEIPIHNNSNCSFLNKEGRKNRTVFDGKTYQSDYHKYGLVPNIDIDTMYISEGKIILIKKIENGNFGFVFK